MAKRTLTPGGTSLNHVARHSSRRSRKMMGERTPRASMYVFIAVGLLGRDARRSIQAQFVLASLRIVSVTTTTRDRRETPHATRQLLVSDVCVCSCGTGGLPRFASQISKSLQFLDHRDPLSCFTSTF